MKYMKVTNVNNQNRFICFKVDGLSDGFVVGLTYLNNDENRKAITVAYKGDIAIVPFDADSEMIKRINEGIKDDK